MLVLKLHSTNQLFFMISSLDTNWRENLCTTWHRKQCWISACGCCAAIPTSLWHQLPTPTQKRQHCIRM